MRVVLKFVGSEGHNSLGMVQLSMDIQSVDIVSMPSSPKYNTDNFHPAMSEKRRELQLEIKFLASSLKCFQADSATRPKSGRLRLRPSVRYRR